MPDLAKPDFIDRNPEQIISEMIAYWEDPITGVGKTLYPAQVERLLIGLASYRENLVRNGIQNAGLQNLVNYATGVNLDQLGALLEAPRLAEASAQTTIEFRVAVARAIATLIPAQTRIGITGTNLNFSTDSNAVIAAGQLTTTTIATASSPGTLANGFAANAIDQLIDPVDGATLTAKNITTSSGGADAESDDRYRSRLKIAPSKFSVAGSKEAYKYWALTADQSIVDVAIVSPRRLQVKVYPLLTSGLPTTEILNKVTAAISGEKVRPLNDAPEVLAPTQISYSIAANIVLFSNADAATLTTNMNAAAQSYAADKRSRLGQDIITSQIIAALSLPGVYSATLTAPSSSLTVAPNEWANAVSIAISITGTNDG